MPRTRARRSRLPTEDGIRRVGLTKRPKPFGTEFVAEFGEQAAPAARVAFNAEERF